MAIEHHVRGTNSRAPFTLTVHRGDGMALLAMDWRGGTQPPKDFVGFGIQYVPPGGTKPLNVSNRLTFAGAPDFRPSSIYPRPAASVCESSRRW